MITPMMARPVPGFSDGNAIAAIDIRNAATKVTPAYGGTGRLRPRARNPIKVAHTSAGTVAITTASVLGVSAGVLRGLVTQRTTMISSRGLRSIPETGTTQSSAG
jgi:hypothetical protein